MDIGSVSPQKKAVILDCSVGASPLRRKLSDYDVIILWNTKEITGSESQWFGDIQIVSMADLIAIHKHEVHRDYLEWIYCASFSESGSSSNIDKLRVSGFPSLWWGSLIFEKCNFQKSPYIHTVLKIIALRKWLNDNPLTSLEIRAKSFSVPLRSCLKVLCRLAGIEYVARFGDSCYLRFGLALVNILTPIRRICSYIAGIIWLLRAYMSAVLCRLGTGVKPVPKIRTSNRITLVSYADQSAKSSISTQGLNSSVYWGDLPGALRDCELGVNWIYLFVPDRQLSSLKKAVKYFHRLNSVSPKSQVHLVLDSLFDFALLCKCIFSLSVLAIKNCSGSASNVLPSCQGLDIGIFYHHDYLSSSVGVAAARNLFYAALFENLFSEIRVQSKVVYLQENMDWEYSLLEIARKYSAAKIIGFPHTSISYWDLRYSYPRIEHVPVVDLMMPIPDVIAMSGPLAKESFLEKNPWLVDKLVDVEALRYIKPCPRTRGRTQQKSQPSRLSILLLGVYTERETELLMSLLMDALPRIKTVYDVKLAIKFHPACNMKAVADRIFRSDFDVLEGDIYSLSEQFDIVLCGSYSACLDVVISGVQPFVYADPSGPVISPLYGTNLAIFVSGPDEFSSAVVSMRSTGADASLSSRATDLFNVDPCLKLWINLLAA